MQIPTTSSHYSAKNKIGISGETGEFVMHHHDNEDEFFFVLKGLLKMDCSDRIIDINEGEFIIIPKGIKHRPIADIETHLLLFEPDSILNTGNVRNELTLDSPQRI